MKSKKSPSPRPVAKKPASSLNLTPAQAEREAAKLKELSERLNPSMDESDTSARSDLIGRD
ncbi:MAG: hypothetical protein ABI222_14435 [Opitutaceae bacterium]